MLTPPENERYTWAKFRQIAGPGGAERVSADSVAVNRPDASLLFCTTARAGCGAAANGSTGPIQYLFPGLLKTADREC